MNEQEIALITRSGHASDRSRGGKVTSTKSAPILGRNFSFFPSPCLSAFSRFQKSSRKFLLSPGGTCLSFRAYLSPCPSERARLFWHRPFHHEKKILLLLSSAKSIVDLKNYQEIFPKKKLPSFFSFQPFLVYGTDAGNFTSCKADRAVFCSK